MITTFIESLGIFFVKYGKWIALVILLGVIGHFVKSAYDLQIKMYNEKLEILNTKISEIQEINNKNMKEIEKLKKVAEISSESNKITHDIKNEEENNSSVMVEENFTIPTAPVTNTPRLVKSLIKLDTITSKTIDGLEDL